MTVEPATKQYREEAARRRTRPLDITVLRGGPSDEREVSLMSGRAVAEALRRCGHSVTEADIDPGDTSALDRAGLEVVFIALHGRFGENGEVQRLCEQHGLAYVGSGPEASEWAMDKDASKRLLRKAGLATPDWVLLDRSLPRSQWPGVLGAVPPPCVLKPLDGGSSVDISIARDEPARDAELQRLVEKYGRAMIEAFIEGREMEIRPARPFYDYVAKYEDDATQYIVVEDLPPAVDQHLRAAGLTAHKALGCRDFSRVDFILTPAGVAHVLEVNTIPGFTSHSLLPKAAAASKISFEQLCDRIVHLALQRAEA
jgi:D-alanine-D-alanine ligase